MDLTSLRTLIRQTASSRKSPKTLNGQSSLTVDNYVDQLTAQLKSLISSGQNAPAYMGVDYATYITNVTQGRASARIESKKTFTHGLIISDIAHMPGGICGTWPARKLKNSQYCTQ